VIDQAAARARSRQRQDARVILQEARTRARRMPAEQRRAEIVCAAVPLVRRRGRAVTTKQIADAAGVSEGTLFHVFADKEAIIAAVVERELAPSRLLEALRRIDRDADLHQRLVDIVEVLRRRLAGVFELMTALGMHRPPTTEGHRRPSHHEALDAITELLRPDAGRLRYPPERTAAMIRLFTFAASHPAISDHDPLPSDQIADVLLHGIATGPDRATPSTPDGAPAVTSTTPGDAPC
jgi:AcrR family transcriptional regulator